MDEGVRRRPRADGDKGTKSRGVADGLTGRGRDMGPEAQEGTGDSSRPGGGEAQGGAEEPHRASGGSGAEELDNTSGRDGSRGLVMTSRGDGTRKAGEDLGMGWKLDLWTLRQPALETSLVGASGLQGRSPCRSIQPKYSSKFRCSGGRRKRRHHADESIFYPLRFCVLSEVAIYKSHNKNNPLSLIQ